MRRFWLVWALMISTGPIATGQACPQAVKTGETVPSEVQTLEGQLVFHDGIRQWFELKLDKPRCGETSVQLFPGEGNRTPIEVLRGCRVRSRGVLYLSTTGYFSLDQYQDAEAIEPVGHCRRQPLFPNYDKAKPAPAIRAYRVEMEINNEPGDHPIVFRVTSGGRRLHPWQAYASYWLTGGFVLYGLCGAGFVVETVFGTAEATLGHFSSPRTPEDMAMFAPESASRAGKKDVRLGYTCVRESSAQR
jgi:hypothetical protein